MKLSQCKLGEVVKIIGTSLNNIFTYTGRIGHIVGLDETESKLEIPLSEEILVKVECSCGFIVKVFPSEIELYADAEAVITSPE